MKYLALTLLLALSGCSNVQVKDLLNDLEKSCTRDYTFSLSSGGVGGVGASGAITGNIHCKPTDPNAAAATTTGAAQ